MSEEKIKRERLGLAVGLSVVVIVLEVVSAVVIYRFFKDWNLASNFGESFGAVNSLFSGLALAGIVCTLLLQRKALEEQRVQFLKADEESLRTQTDRAKTYEMLNRQVEALNRAVEIHAIQLYITHLEQQIKHTQDKTKLLNEKETCFQRLKNLLELNKPA
ncbi:MAG TPA: hypothetical protein VJS13_17105 [Pyrinomonadaceae bacterium]|nr:hypothetical protein [Pyrinomonadaceae bacterium]